MDTVWDLIKSGGVSGVLLVISFYFYRENKYKDGLLEKRDDDLKELSRSVIKQLTLNDVNLTNNKQEHSKLEGLLNTIVQLLKK